MFDDSKFVVEYVIRLGYDIDSYCMLYHYAFSAMTLLVGHQEEHLACKKLSDEVLVWFFLERDAGATASPNPIISCLI